MSLTAITQQFRVDQDLNGGGGGDQQIIVEALTDGGFAVAWVDLNAGGFKRISVRKFDANGNPVSEETRLTGVDRENSDNGGQGFGAPSIAALPNGAFAVEYNDFGSGLNNSNGSQNFAFWTVTALFGANGALQSQTFPAGRPNGSSNSIFSSSIAADGAGGFHHAYQQANSPSAVFVNGVQVASGNGISTTGIADFGDGAFVVYEKSDATGFGTDLAGRVVNGSVAGPEFLINTRTAGFQSMGGGTHRNENIATLTNGSVVVAWSDSSSADEDFDPGTGVRARIFGSDGQAVTGEILLTNTPAGDESQPTIAAMSGGRFVAVWREGDRATAQVFSSTGQRLGDQVDLGIVVNASAGRLSVTVLTGDKVVVVWGNGVNAQIFQAAAAPIADNDAYETGAGRGLTVGAANGVLVGDVDADSTTLTAFLKTGPANGDLTLNGDGSFTYTPKAGFSGTDTFTYAASDGSLESSPATVTIAVKAPVQVQSGQTYDLSKNQNFIGSPSDFNEAKFDALFEALLKAAENASSTEENLTLVSFALTLLKSKFLSQIKLKFGSIQVNIDGDGDGVFDTVFSLTDPAPNVTFLLGQQGEDATITVQSLAQSTSGDDTITGTDNPDYIAGGDGNDTLNGGGGSDALVGGAGSDTLSGGAGVDDLVGGDGFDTLDGGAGADTMAGGAGDDVYVVDDAGDVVTEAAGGGDADEVRTALATYRAPAGVEKVTYTGTGVANVRGNGGNDNLAGGDGDDIFYLQDGGDDTASGGGGNDAFYLGGALTGADKVDGGAGSLDQIGLQGDYSGGVMIGGPNITGVEQLVFLPGNDARFGDSASNFYDYKLIWSGGLLSGQRLVITANTLREGEDLTFDGSAEANGFFLTYGGLGVDAITGGQKDDGIFFGIGRFGANDKVDGQGGHDQLGLQGDYSGDNRVILGDGQLVGIEQLVFLSGGDARFGNNGLGYAYDITTSDGNVAAGATLVVSANTLRADEFLDFDGRAETDGRFRVFGGQGTDVIIGGAGDDEIFGGLSGDVLLGGGGADIFVYTAVAQSTGTGFDKIVGFDYRVDKIDLPFAVGGFSDAVDGAVSMATFDADLARLLDGVLAPGTAAALEVRGGDMNGRFFGIVDANGIAGYQAGEDYVVEFVLPASIPDPTIDFLI